MQALRVKTIADHGAFDAAANPSKYPAGLFHIITGSYPFTKSFVEVDGAYTNKPPGGIAYRCSFRVTEAAFTIERLVDVLALELKKDPAELRMQNFIPPTAFRTSRCWVGSTTQATTAARSGSRWTRSATPSCARSKRRSASAGSSWESASRRSPRSSERD